MLQKRLPPGISGSPGVDGIFQTLWLAIISVQLWGFLYMITFMSIQEFSPLLATGMFALLFFLLAATVITLGNRIRH